MSFSMEIPNEEIIKEEIIEKVKPKDTEILQLKVLAEKNVQSLIDFDLDNLSERKNILKSIEDFGTDTMQKSSNKNSLLSVSIKKLSSTGEEGSFVADSLVKLQREMKDLDPSGIDFTRKGFFGKIFNPLRSYFEKYETADSTISNILESLEKGKNTLKNDNTTLEIEEVALRDLTKKLMKEIQMGSLMDENIDIQIQQAKARNEDEDKIRFISEEILFPLRQKVLDMQSMIAVNQQGIIAMELIRRNNNELIRGVDRAKTVTISALRTASMLAGALYNQKVTLKKIESLNKTTNELIANTSKMLRTQGVEIHKQAIQSSISVETLKNAFIDYTAAMEDISNFKTQALPMMKQSIEQFRELSELGEKQIQKLEKGRMLESI